MSAPPLTGADGKVHLSAALNYLVDTIMETYGLDPLAKPELKKVLLHVGAATASMMSEYYTKELTKVIPPEEAAPSLPWASTKKGDPNVN